MRIHTSLDVNEVKFALNVAKEAGAVEAGVVFDNFESHASRTHAHGYEIHLGTDTKTADVRRNRPSTGNSKFQEPNGKFATYAATWEEWGWFIAVLYELDPDMRVDSVSRGYSSADDFREQTNHEFIVSQKAFN